MDDAGDGHIVHPPPPLPVAGDGRPPPPPPLPPPPPALPIPIPRAGGPPPPSVPPPPVSPLIHKYLLFVMNMPRTRSRVDNDSNLLS
uniref:Uncharacterized protein n=1 Tax=Amphimedon queenslandica TaxID=400682 RepID=A0A1X7U1A1_AMPQE